MAVFAYKAADGGAAIVRGTIAADSPRQARDQLRARGLVVQEISPQAQPARCRPLGRGGQPLRRAWAELLGCVGVESWHFSRVARYV
jgi:type II secretory pathway component PulF